MFYKTNFSGKQSYIKQSYISIHAGIPALKKIYPKSFILQIIIEQKPT